MLVVAADALDALGGGEAAVAGFIGGERLLEVEKVHYIIIRISEEKSFI